MADITIDTQIEKIVNFKNVKAGDTFRRILTITVTGTGDPVDLTNVTVKMEVKAKATGAALLSFTEGDGITKNINVITLDKIITLKGGNYVYDMEFTYPDERVVTYIGGSFIVVQDVTNAQTN